MTINTNTTFVVAEGNGVTSDFSYNFLIPATADVNVFYTDIDGNVLQLTPAEYTISGIGNPAGGSVIYPLVGSPIAAGTTLTISRNVPLLQLTTIANQGAFYPRVVESALDYLMMAIQDLNSRIIADGPPSPVPPSDLPATVEPQGRSSLTNGVAVTTNDVAGATTLYWVPVGGSRIPIWTGSQWIWPKTAQLVLALDSNSGHVGYQQAAKNFDVFATSNGGVVVQGTGPDWTLGAVPGSATARGTGVGSTELELFEGYWVNKNSIRLRIGSASGDTIVVPARSAIYLSTIRPTANGQCEDSAANRLVYNLYNQASRSLFRTDPTDSWNYKLTAYRQWNANAANKVTMVRGFNDNAVSVFITALMGQISSATTRSGFFGVGIDTTTFKDLLCIGGIVNVNSGIGALPAGCSWVGFPGLGYHEINLVEKGVNSADTQTWYGDISVPNDIQTGLSGTCFA